MSKEKRKENRTYIYKNIISARDLSEYCVKRYNEDNNSDFDDYDFYDLDNCRDFEKNYYIELLESRLCNYIELVESYDSSVQAISEENFILRKYGSESV